MDKPDVKIRPGITALVRQLYSAESDEKTWLEGIQQAALEALGHPRILQVGLVHITPDGRGRMASDIVGPGPDNLRPELVPPEVIRRLYLAGPLNWGSDAITGDDRPMLAALKQLRTEYQIQDGLGVVGMDPSGHALIMSIGVTSRRLSPRVRTTLTQLAGHMATAYRLRLAPTSPAVVVDPTNGEVLDQPGPEPPSTRTLQGAALDIERAQRHDGNDPEAALGFWKALVEGRWSLVERFESDGRRILVACQNEPETQAHRALSESERKVVALVSLSHSQKLVAYELGYSEVVVSRLIKSALVKLGLRSRSQLIELRGAIGELP